MIIREGLPRTIFFAAAGLLIIVVLIWGGFEWGHIIKGQPGPPGLPVPLFPGSNTPPRVVHPFVEVLKLVAAAIIGFLVSAFYRRSQPERTVNRPLEQAQVLLCVAGAMMMIIIGDSFARALGVLGGASIIRFRTPVDDPKDTVLLFLLLGLGMSCGLGSFAVAGLGTLFLCVFLMLLENIGSHKPRTMMLNLVATGTEFPVAHVRDVFARSSVVSWEQREMIQGPKGSMKYFVTLEPFASLAAINAELTAEGSGIQSVTWEVPKRSE